MDTKLTLSFDQEVIEKAKQFAEKNNISLSRLTEYLYSKLTDQNYPSLEDLPISSWVNEVAEGAVEYKSKPRSRDQLRSEYFESKK